jgi:hypothetical protein
VPARVPFEPIRDVGDVAGLCVDPPEKPRLEVQRYHVRADRFQGRLEPAQIRLKIVQPHGGCLFQFHGIYPFVVLKTSIC